MGSGGSKNYGSASSNALRNMGRYVAIVQEGEKKNMLC
jgi:hypothetical protein